MTAAAKRSFASLEIFNYRLYFGGQLASLAGNWMQIVAELWLILSLTGSGFAVGLATALQFSGIMLFGALGGSLADRFDKRRLLLVTQVAMALPALALFGLALGGAVQLWMVFVLIGVRGLVLAADNPARQSFVAELVGPSLVVNAVGLNSILVHSARIVGPALAGLLIAGWGVTPCFAFNAATFGVMFVALWRMRPEEMQSRPPRQDSYRIRDGLSYVRRTPELRVPLLLMAVLGTLGFNFQVILPLLARFSFGGDVSSYTALVIAMGVGAITGSLITSSRTIAGPRMLIGSAGGFAISATLAAAAPTIELEMVALALLGAASVGFAATINAGLQLAAEPEMRGRVMALYSMVFIGTTPIGGPLAGWIAEAVSPRASLLVGALAAAGVAAAVVAGERPRPVAASVWPLGTRGRFRGWTPPNIRSKLSSSTTMSPSPRSGSAHGSSRAPRPSQPCATRSRSATATSTRRVSTGTSARSGPHSAAPASRARRSS